jgi:UDP-arabinose 4-epimerase
MSMQAVVVTGGAGFIGSHVCKALARAGYVPVTYDNLSRGNRAAVRFGPFERGDVRDVAALSDVFRRHRAIGVIHMAAYAYVRESVTDPLAYYENNVVGSIRLLAAMQTSGVRVVVFSSTCAVYGTARQIPISEADPLDPINPYGASKLMVERAMRDIGGRAGIRSLSLRYFNAAGSDPDLEIGEWHHPETHAIPLCVMAARGEIKSFDLLGDDHATADGTPVRDYIHVADLADVHVRGLEYLRDNGPTRALNVGLGHGHTVREIIKAVEKVACVPVPVRVLDRHAADPPALVADGRAAQDLLGFKPRHTSIETMVAHAWDWRKKVAAASGYPEK